MKEQRREIETLRKELEKLKMVIKEKDQEISKIAENKKTGDPMARSFPFKPMKTKPLHGGSPEGDPMARSFPLKPVKTRPNKSSWTHPSEDQANKDMQTPPLEVTNEEEIRGQIQILL